MSKHSNKMLLRIRHLWNTAFDQEGNPEGQTARKMAEGLMEVHGFSQAQVFSEGVRFKYEHQNPLRQQQQAHNPRPQQQQAHNPRPQQQASNKEQYQQRQRKQARHRTHQANQQPRNPNSPFEDWLGEFWTRFNENFFGSRPDEHETKRQREARQRREKRNQQAEARFRRQEREKKRRQERRQSGHRRAPDPSQRRHARPEPEPTEVPFPFDGEFVVMDPTYFGLPAELKAFFYELPKQRNWQRWLIAYTAKHAGCDCTYETKTKQVTIYGKSDDIAFAIVLFHSYREKLEEEAQEIEKSDRNDFFVNAVYGVGERLEQVRLNRRDKLKKAIFERSYKQACELAEALVEATVDRDRNNNYDSDWYERGREIVDE